MAQTKWLGLKLICSFCFVVQLVLHQLLGSVNTLQVETLQLAKTKPEVEVLFSSGPNTCEYARTSLLVLPPDSFGRNLHGNTEGLGHLESAYDCRLESAFVVLKHPLFCTTSEFALQAVLNTLYYDLKVC